VDCSDQEHCWRGCAWVFKRTASLLKVRVDDGDSLSRTLWLTAVPRQPASFWFMSLEPQIISLTPRNPSVISFIFLIFHHFSSLSFLLLVESRYLWLKEMLPSLICDAASTKTAVSCQNVPESCLCVLSYFGHTYFFLFVFSNINWSDLLRKRSNIR